VAAFPRVSSSFDASSARTGSKKEISSRDVSKPVFALFVRGMGFSFLLFGEWHDSEQLITEESVHENDVAVNSKPAAERRATSSNEMSRPSGQMLGTGIITS
jgi:hypothetical protein